jgi:hypothetical protein
MAEIINKKAAAPEPFKVGKDPKIKVKAKRPVLLGHHDADGTPVRVEKDEVGFVEEAEYNRHAHILEKLALLILLLGLLLLPRAVEAQSYSVSQTSTNNTIVAAQTGLQTGFITGGVMVASAVTNGTTNFNACTVVGVTRYDSCVVMLTANTAAGASPATNTLFVFPCDDGVTVDTNHPLAALSVFNTAGTNLIGTTNLSNAILGAHGYIGFGLGNQTGGVVSTNPVIQVFVKPQRSG